MSNAFDKMAKMADGLVKKSDPEDLLGAAEKAIDDANGNIDNEDYGVAADQLRYGADRLDELDALINKSADGGLVKKALRFGGDFQGVVSAIESSLSNAVSAYKDEDLAGTVAAVEMAEEQITDLLEIVSEGAEGIE